MFVFEDRVYRILCGKVNSLKFPVQVRLILVV